MERVAAKICEGLIRRGHSVAVLTLRTCSAPAVEVDGALTIYRVPAADLTSKLGVQFAVSARVYDAIARLIRRFHPDLVHAHNLFFRTTEAGALLRLLFRVPLITTLHLGKPAGGGLFNMMVQIYEATMGKFITCRSDHLTAVSRAVAEHAREIGGYKTPLTVIPNGVDTSIFFPRLGQTDGRQKILFVARLVPNKGPETLLRAVPAVLANHPQAEFLLVGDGPLLNKLQEQTRQNGIGHAVHFLGTRTDVPELMRESGIFVRPSTLEGMPLTVLEAMASALPVIATPVGGTPELVQDGVNGYLMPVGDSNMLAESIIKLLDNTALARKMGKYGREMVGTSYSWEAVVEQTERVYTEVLKRW